LSHDLFGHVINLNFNRQGSSHKTLIGGIASILIKIFMAIYIGLKLNKLINRLDPNNEAITSLTKLDEIDPVPFNETSL